MRGARVILFVAGFALGFTAGLLVAWRAACGVCDDEPQTGDDAPPVQRMVLPMPGDPAERLLWTPTPGQDLTKSLFPLGVRE